MNAIYIVIIYDESSFETDKRVEIRNVFKTKRKAEDYAKNLVLKSFENYEIKKYEVT